MHLSIVHYIAKLLKLHGQINIGRGRKWAFFNRCLCHSMRIMCSFHCWNIAWPQIRCVLIWLNNMRAQNLHNDAPNRMKHNKTYCHTPYAGNRQRRSRACMGKYINNLSVGVWVCNGHIWTCCHTYLFAHIENPACRASGGPSVLPYLDWLHHSEHVIQYQLTWH